MNQIIDAGNPSVTYRWTAFEIFATMQQLGCAFNDHCTGIVSVSNQGGFRESWEPEKKENRRDEKQAENH